MPSGNLSYQRGEIRWVTETPPYKGGASSDFVKLDPTVGAEAQKTRACLIVQNDIMNQHGLLTIVIPFRPGRKEAPYAVNILKSVSNGLDKDRFLDVGQIRSVDGQRIGGRVGVLEEHYWPKIQEALAIILGFVL